MRPNRLISCCLAIAGVLVAVAAVPASADGPTVSATPSQNLVDAQPVMVSASGFAADRQMAVVECGTVTVSPATCDLNTVAFVVTDDTGAYNDFAFTVQRVLSDGTDCALNGGCAELLGISRSSAYKCVRRGEIPALTLGRRVVIAKATIDTLRLRVRRFEQYLFLTPGGQC